MADDEKNVVLREELEFFESKREEWIKIYEGKFALVKGNRLIDTFTTLEEAYRKGVELFGNGPFLIKVISKEEKIEKIPALTLGIIHAHL